MKKVYLSLISACFILGAHAQDAFWTPTNYKGAFPITDGTPATDWTSGWTNFDPENTVYPATLTTVSTDVVSSTTWSGVILLQNKVYVKNNATLTILPGTIIRGDKLTQGTLIITRGAKINAQGTASNPIIFTTNEAIGNRNEGDWGGVILLGLAKNNQPGGVVNIEGIPPTTDTQHGGNFDNDNSGFLTYTRVEFAGIPLEPNKEINGITLGSVGSATTMHHLQVSFSGDDSYEWFGGTVNAKYIIAYRGLDDDFDTDFGFRGKIQFGLSIRDKDMSDAAGDSNSFESDNDAAGSAAQPKTMPVFSNMTLIGPKGNGSIVLPVGEKFEKAFRLRRNTATSVFNSLVTGWEKGLSFEGTAVVANVNGDSLIFSNNSLTNFANGVNIITSSGVSGGLYQSIWSVDGNDSTQSIPQVNWVNIFTNLGVTPDARLNVGSSAASGATFVHPKFFSVIAPTISTPITYCQNAISSNLSATAIAGNTLYWYTSPSGGIGTTSAPIPSTNTPGTFTFYVSQKNIAGDESPRVAITVMINALPATPSITASGSTSFCSGGSVDLMSSYPNGNLWSNNATSSLITVSNSGNFTVTYTDANGCSSTSSSISVNVSNAPIPTINTTSIEACSGDSISLTSSVSDSYLWSTGDTTQSIVVTSTSTVSVMVTNSNACNGVGSSSPITVTFTSTPTALGSFTSNGNVVYFNNTSTGASAYSWDFGDQTNSSASAPAHAYTGNGSYTVTLTAINGNCSSTYTMLVEIAVSLDELEDVQTSMYPNPSKDQVFVELTGANFVSILVLDSYGRIVIQGTDKNFSVDQLSEGMYQVRILTDKGMTTKKLMVTK